MTRLILLIPLILATLLPSGTSQHSNSTNSTKALTPGEESILLEAYQVIGLNFQYRRHEWAFSSVKYAGFLRFFAASWRLVARLGGTYRHDGSAYYNRWNWEEALAKLAGYLGDLQLYYRVYRHLQARPELLADMLQRHPQLQRASSEFLEFMRQRDSVSEQEAGYPGYLATTGWRYRLLTGLAGAGCGQISGDAQRLVDSARLIVSAAVGQTDALLHGWPGPPDPDSLVAIATNYTELSKLAWDRVPAALAKMETGVLKCQPPGGNYSQSNVTEAAAWLSRQVLGHVLLYLASLQAYPWPKKQGMSQIQSVALNDLYCRVVREDIDKSLELHLEVREMAELTELLDSCQSVKSAWAAAYSELESLWRSLRVRIWREYSAFQQYSNRVPAILKAKSAAKVALPAIAVVGLGLNGLILVYFSCSRSARQVGRNLLIALLACFDSLILATSSLVLFTDRYMEHDQDLKPGPGSDLWCKFQAYLLNLPVECSAFLVVILSVERFLAVYSLFRRHPDPDELPHPPQSHKELPRRKLSIMALCAVCFACIFNCMLIIGDEAAAPAKSTVGRQCVHYVRLHNFGANLAYVTRVKPLLNALVRSLLPYSLVCLLSLATCWLLFKKGAYQSLHQCQAEELQQQQQQQQLHHPDTDADWSSELQQQSAAGGQLSRAMGQLALACAYLLLTAPAPVVYTLFMTAHADRLMVRLTNGLYDEADPAFRSHWARIGRLTVAQYATEYALVPLSAAVVNFCALCLTDVGFRGFLARSVLRQRRQSDRRQLQQQQQQLPIIAEDWEQTEII